MVALEPVEVVTTTFSGVIRTPALALGADHPATATIAARQLARLRVGTPWPRRIARRPRTAMTVMSRKPPGRRREGGINISRDLAGHAARMHCMGKKFEGW